MANVLTLDMETRSCVDLRKCGVYVYAQSETTDVLCIGVKKNDDKTHIWIPDKFKHIIKDASNYLPVISNSVFTKLLVSADKICAHNAQFERTLWNDVLSRDYTVPFIPIDMWHDTAAKAAYYALPRSLENVCSALSLPIKKDSIGYRVMMKMCKPSSRTGLWHENAEDFITLCHYCIQDVEAERCLDKALFDIPEEELRVWRLDQLINDTGVYVDTEAIDNLLYKVESKEAKMLLEVQNITNGFIRSPTQRDNTIRWLKDNGVELPDLTKNTVIKALQNETLPEKVRRLLELRQSLSKSSVAKLTAMKRMACNDSRIRGTLLYHGASTGRWSGRGIQPQNYPRSTHEAQDIETLLAMGVNQVEEKYGCVIQQASKCLRGMLCAPEGKELLCADFESIEARVLAWLSQDEKSLDAFRNGKDLYKVTASDIYKVPYDEISKEQRQIGKVAVLALGYQGWLGAFQSMADVYGMEVEEDDAKNIILSWRDAHPKIVSYWHGVQDAAIKAVATNGTYSYGKVKYGMRDRFLHCRLPSGRLLSYYDPSITTRITKWGQVKEVIEFKGVDSLTNKWGPIQTYGGKLTENIVQAVARDLLVSGLNNINKEGYKIVLHVHDEILIESDPGMEVHTVENLMSKAPDWANGCPVSAEGWKGKRYKK